MQLDRGYIMTGGIKWDVFISHASEDKEKFVKPLVELLENNGVKVWYDDFSLKPGESLLRSIDKGLSKSNYGVVVLSKAFMKKSWTEYELRGLVTREMAGRKTRIISIWYGVTHREVMSFSPSLADKVALDSTKFSILEIAFGIIETVRPDIFQNLMRQFIYLQMRADAKHEYIPMSQLVTGPIRHAALPRSLLLRIEIIHKIFHEELYPMPLEEVITNFRHDNDPLKEIQVWEKIAVAYLSLTANRKLDLEQKREIFSALLGSSMGSLTEQDFSKFKYVTPEMINNELKRINSKLMYEQ